MSITDKIVDTFNDLIDTLQDKIHLAFVRYRSNAENKDIAEVIVNIAPPTEDEKQLINELRSKGISIEERKKILDDHKKKWVVKPEEEITKEADPAIEAALDEKVPDCIGFISSDGTVIELIDYLAGVSVTIGHFEDGVYFIVVDKTGVRFGKYDVESPLLIKAHLLMLKHGGKPVMWPEQSFNDGSTLWLRRTITIENYYTGK